jgi:putative stress-induced transcription regulator/CGNR zinc finger protein
MSDWVWDGGRSSLDLLNTVRDRSRRARETLRGPADLAAWLREASLLGDASDPGEDDLNAARRLRAAIDTLTFPPDPPDPPDPAEHRAGPQAAKALEAAKDAVAVVNAAAAHAPLGPRLALSGDGHAFVVPPRPSVAAALGRIALDAIELLGGDEQLRVCAADDCGIRFVDRSPSGNRQWCSMRRCGNRLKARRHYARTGSADRG